ncbi:hypothetical protein D3C81_2138800 [compost metagenome]
MFFCSRLSKSTEQPDAVIDSHYFFRRSPHDRLCAQNHAPAVFYDNAGGLELSDLLRYELDQQLDQPL